MTGERGKPSAPPVVGGFPEPDGNQPMTDAEFRMVREALGLSGEWLASWLGVTLRTLRRWEAGHSPVPDGIRVEMETLEATAVEQTEYLLQQLRDSADAVLTLPRETDTWSPGWWRMVAYRVAAEVPGLYVRYSDSSSA